MYKAIGFDRDRESNTACCVYNDGSGCVQSVKKECSVSIVILILIGMRNIVVLSSKTWIIK